MKRMISALVFFTLLFFSSTVFGSYTIGVLAKRGAPKCMQQWGAMASYLSQQTGEKFRILPLKFTAIEPAVKAGKIDFMLANSAFYVEMKKKYGVKAIATLINSRKGKALKQFGGVLFVKKSKNIRKIKDLRGKSFMVVKFSSFGGGHMVWRLLVENGINPKRDFSKFIEGKKHDNVVLAVQNGTVDVGTVRSDTLERMHDEGKININDFRILNQKKDKFPFVRSTRLYPEWPMASLPKTNKRVAKKVASALKSMNKNSNAAKKAKIMGWTSPLDYDPVADCLKKIKYGIFSK